MYAAADENDGLAYGDTNTVATLFTDVKSSSSHVRTSSDFWRVNAVLPKSFGTSAFSQLSPVPIEQSCVSLHKFGVMKAKFGAAPAARSVDSWV
ncbi:MAG TPA: hypothetical protein VNG70_09355 [Candidatus Limnocylindria bacterium]|nr:hypothetical protein [Candidatus Limnocylindria bacterium]